MPVNLCKKNRRATIIFIGQIHGDLADEEWVKFLLPDSVVYAF